jgi:hypothetical protein
MNGFARYIALLVVCMASAPLTAARAGSSDQAMDLTACRARYTAVLEHSWLVGGNTDAMRMRRDMFAALVDALTPDATQGTELERRLLHFRVQQKHVAAQLLTTARFGTDPRRARYALSTIVRQMQACDRMLMRSGMLTD